MFIVLLQCNVIKHLTVTVAMLLVIGRY